VGECQYYEETCQSLRHKIIMDTNKHKIQCISNGKLRQITTNGTTQSRGELTYLMVSNTLFRIDFSGCSTSTAKIMFFKRQKN